MALFQGSASNVQIATLHIFFCLISRHLSPFELTDQPFMWLSRSRKWLLNRVTLRLSSTITAKSESNVSKPKGLDLVFEPTMLPNLGIHTDATILGPHCYLS